MADIRTISIVILYNSHFKKQEWIKYNRQIKGIHAWNIYRIKEQVIY
jgi:hypothetical protein